MNNLCYLFDIILGYIVDVKYWCFILLRVNFNYIYDSGLGVSCGIDLYFFVCLDWVIFCFNYFFCFII